MFYNDLQCPLENIDFLDDIQIKIQNMRFQSLTNDQTVPRYRYFHFCKPHKVDGKRFSSQMPTLKTVPSDQKSNRRTCAEECQMPFNKRGTKQKIIIINRFGAQKSCHNDKMVIRQGSSIVWLPGYLS